MTGLDIYFCFWMVDFVIFNVEKRWILLKERDIGDSYCVCLVVWKKLCLDVRQKKLILLRELVKLKFQKMLFFLFIATEN